MGDLAQLRKDNIKIVDCVDPFGIMLYFASAPKHVHGFLAMIFTSPSGTLKPTEALGRVLGSKFKWQGADHCQGIHWKCFYLTFTT